VNSLGPFRTCFENANDKSARIDSFLHADRFGQFTFAQICRFFPRSQISREQSFLFTRNISGTIWLQTDGSVEKTANFG
jgi:hypothetical protein